MNKKEYQIYERTMDTAKRLERLYFNQKEQLKKLYDYIELRKQQLEYIESKEEMDFILSVLNKIIQEVE